MHKLLLLLSIGCAVGCVDQTTKYQAVAHLTAAFAARDGASPSLGDRVARFVTESHPQPLRSISVIDGFWDFRYVENPGGFWSLARDVSENMRVPLLLGLSLVVMIALVIIYVRTPPERLLVRVGIALALGGALGNFVDRARFGYVIDFIDWHWQRTATWPTFNVADVAISVGMGLLLLESLRRQRAS
jgi:signal peptidase II